MKTIPVYQYDLAGRYLGETTADESPLEPGVFHLPARTTMEPPPARDTWPEAAWPRWTGTTWAMTGAAVTSKPAAVDPALKLQKFLSENPDVAALIGIDATA